MIAGVALVLIIVAIFAVYRHAFNHAPEGWEDEIGFHWGRRD